MEQLAKQHPWNKSAKVPMNTNLSQHQFNPSQNTHHLQPIQPKPQTIQAMTPPLKHQLPPELKPKRLKRERQLKPKADLKPNLHCDPYPNLISIVKPTQSTPKRPPPIRTQKLLKQPTTLNPVTTNSTQPKTTEKETEKREKKNQNREKRGKRE